MTTFKSQKPIFLRKKNCSKINVGCSTENIFQKSHPLKLSFNRRKTDSVKNQYGVRRHISYWIRELKQMIGIFRRLVCFRFNSHFQRSVHIEIVR